MKADTNYHKGKPPSLEEGPMRYQRMNDDSHDNRVEKGSKCNRCLQFMRVVLYIETVLIIGLLGCIVFTYYFMQESHSSPSRLYDSERGYNYHDRVSLIDPDVTISENIASVRGKQIEASLEKSEIRTDPMIQKEGNLMETKSTTPKMTTTPRFAVMEDMKGDDSMVLSKWLSTLNHGNSEKWNDDSRKSDDISSDMPISVENDELALSLKQIFMLGKNSDSESTTQNWLGDWDVTSDPLSVMDGDNLYPRQYWQDALWPSEYSDELTALERDLFQDDRLTDLRLDFEVPDLVGRYMLRRARAVDAVADDSSSSSSEETKNPAVKVKRAADSSSSSSSSSDSSSSEDDETTTKVTKNENNCPKIVDDEGNTIDDPKDIVNHIKRNWFNWLLETPIPDCDDPSKIVTLDECGKFIIRCTGDEAENETISNNAKEAETNDREARSVEEMDVDGETCEKMINTTQGMVRNFMNHIVAGVNADSEADRLRQIFAYTLMTSTIRMIAVQSIVELNMTYQNILEDVVSDVVQNITESTDAEHRALLNQSLTTPEMINNLRSTIESIVATYDTCRNSTTKPGGAKRFLRDMIEDVEFEKCSIRWRIMQNIQNSLTNEILPGESADENIVERRQTFKQMIFSLARTMARLEQGDSEEPPTGPPNINDEQLRNMLIGLKIEIAKAPKDPVIRKRLLDNNPSTDEQKKGLRYIMEYYLRQYRSCRDFEGFPDEFENGYTEGALRCPRFSSGCNPAANYNESIGVIEEAPSNNRDTRSVEDADVDGETCEKMINTTQGMVRNFMNHIVAGVNADSEADRLRQIFAYTLMTSTIRMIAVQSIVEMNMTYQNILEDVVSGLRQNITDSADAEHRALLEQTLTTPEMDSNLRSTIESIVASYDSCRNSSMEALATKRFLRDMMEEIELEKCSIRWRMMQHIQNSLTNEIVPGESADANVVERRQSFKQMIFSLARTMARSEQGDSEELPTGLPNITDEQLRNMLIELKMEIAKAPADPVIRKRLLDNNPLTDEQKQGLRYIIEYYLRQYRSCRDLAGLTDNFDNGYTEGDLGCPRFIKGCNPAANYNESIGVIEEATTNNRDTRSVAATDVEVGKCESSMNTARRHLVEYVKRVVTGEKSDPHIQWLGDNLAIQVMAISIKMVTAQLVIGVNVSNPSILEDVVLDLKRNITELADAEHRTAIEQNGPTTTEMVEDLRNIVESLETVYDICRNDTTITEPAKSIKEDIIAKIELEKCTINWGIIQDTQQLLTNELVTSELSDDNIVTLDNRFKQMIYSLARTWARLEQGNSEEPPTGPVNITDKQLRNMLTELKMEIAKVPEAVTIQQRLINGDPPTEEQTKQLRTIMEYYLRQYRVCRANEGLPDEFSNAYEESGHECPEFSNGCNPAANNNESIGVIKEAPSSNRDTRSVEETDVKIENCESLMNTTRRHVMEYANRVVIGEDSDPQIKRLQSILATQVIVISLDMVAEHSVVGVNISNPNILEDFVLDLKQNITKIADHEHRASSVQNSPTTTEMVEYLRNIIESLETVYDTCRNATDIIEPIKRLIDNVITTIDLQKCRINWKIIQGAQQSLANELVTSDLSNENVVALHKRFKQMLYSLARTSARLEQGNSEEPPTGPVNITDEQLRNMLIELKIEIAKAPEAVAIQQQLINGNPPTEEQVKQLHKIMEYYLRGYRFCRANEGLPDEFKKGYTEGDHTCPMFSNGCYPAANEDELIGAVTEDTTSNRDTRSVDETVVDIETCERMINTTRENASMLGKQVVPGEDSNLRVGLLRRIFMSVVSMLTVKSIAAQSFPEVNLTDSMWDDTLTELRQNLTNIAGAEDRVLLEQAGPTTKEMVHQLRTVAESGVAYYNTCMGILKNSGEPVTFIIMTVERQKCTLGRGLVENKKESLAAEMVEGESSDAAVVELREKFTTIIDSLAESMNQSEHMNYQVLPTGPVEMTDETWRDKLIKLKTEIAKVSEDAAIRERLENSNPPTKKQTDQLRDIVTYYLRQERECRPIEEIVKMGEQSFSNSEEIGRSNRESRSVEESNADIETCDENINALQRNLHEFASQVVIGEASDPTTESLRRDCVKTIWMLAMRVIVTKAHGRMNSIDRIWGDSWLELRRIIINDADTQHQALFEQSGQTNQEMVDKLRAIIESISRLYTDCRDNLVMTELDPQSLRVLGMLKEQERCSMSLKLVRHKKDSLAAEIVTGESSDATVVELRIKLKKTLDSIIMTMGQLDQQSYVIPTGQFNITDQQLRDKLIELKTMIPEDPAIRQRLQNSESPTEKQINDLRVILEYYFGEHAQCELAFLDFLSTIKGALISGRGQDSNQEHGSISSKVERREIKESHIHRAAGWKGVMKRSIGHPYRKSENSLNALNNEISNRDDFGSSRRMNLDHKLDESLNVDASQKDFFEKMESLSSHIDRLHELYLKYNELGDDYVSKEFPDELPLNIR